MRVLNTYSHFSLKSNIQSFLQLCAGGLFVLVEGMGVDVQRGGGLAVAEDACHRCNIRAARNHQAGGGVSEGMDVQLLRQAVLLEDQLEAVGEGGGRHGELRSLTAEQEVISGQLPLVIGFGDVCTFLPVLPQETFHLGGEVHIAVTCAGLGFFHEDLFVCHLDRVAADVDGTLLPINVAPLQSAALAPPHPRGDDELEVGFVLDALALQRGNDPLRRFLVRDLFLTFAAKYPQCCRQTDDDEQGGLTFEIEKGRLSFRLTAPYSEERRRAASEAAKKCGVHRYAF